MWHFGNERSAVRETGPSLAVISSPAISAWDGDKVPTDIKQHGTEGTASPPVAFILAPLPKSNPSFAQFLPAGADRGTQRREESVIGEVLAKTVLKHLVLAVSLHLGEHQPRALLVERGAKILEHVASSRVNVRNGLCLDDDPLWHWHRVGESTDLVAECTRIGEDQRCIEPIHRIRQVVPHLGGV